MLAKAGDVEGLAYYGSYLPRRQDPFKALREGAFQPIIAIVHSSIGDLVYYSAVFADDLFHIPHLQ
jgi:hypothetical protein